MLAQQSLMVSSHGAMKFGHEGYRKMAEQGSWCPSYELSDMKVVFPNDSTAFARITSSRSWHATRARNTVRK